MMVIASEGMDPSWGDPPLSSNMDPVDAMARTMEDARRTGDGALMGKSGFGSSWMIRAGVGVGVGVGVISILVSILVLVSVSVSSSFAEKSADGGDKRRDDEAVRALLRDALGSFLLILEEMENAET